MTNNYETYRDELTVRLKSDLPEFSEEQVNSFLSIVDDVSRTYNIEKQTTALIASDDGGVGAFVKMFIASKAVEQKSKGTLQNYTFTLTNMFNTIRKPLDQITANDLRVYLYNYQQERHVKNDTINSMMHGISSFFDWCVTEEYLTKDPSKKIRAIKADSTERCFLEPLELEYIRDACKTVRDKAIIDFLFSTGCRVSEMCNVKMTDVNIEKKTVFIEKGKGGKHRTTFLNAEAIVSLKAYLKTRKSDSPYLFTYTRNYGYDRPLSKRAMEETIRKIVEATEPKIDKKITPHVLRHTAATIALRNGMPLEQVKEFLGHSNLNTTMIYAKIDNVDVKRSHEKYLG